MTNLEFILAFSILPVAGVLIGLAAVFLTRDRHRRHLHAGE